MVNTIGFSIAPPFWLLVLFRMVPALFHAVFYAMAITAATDGAPKEIQIRLTSIVIGGIALAQVTVIPLATFLNLLLNIIVFVRIFVIVIERLNSIAFAQNCKNSL